MAAAVLQTLAKQTSSSTQTINFSLTGVTAGSTILVVAFMFGGPHANIKCSDGDGEYVRDLLKINTVNAGVRSETGRPERPPPPRRARPRDRSLTSRR